MGKDGLEEDGLNNAHQMEEEIISIAKDVVAEEIGKERRIRREDINSLVASIDERIKEGDDGTRREIDSLEEEVSLFVKELGSFVGEGDKRIRREIGESIEREVGRRKPNYLARVAGGLALTLAGFGLLQNDWRTNDRIAELRANHHKEVAELRTDYEKRLDSLKIEFIDTSEKLSELKRDTKNEQDFLDNRIETIEDNLDRFDGMDERIVQSEAQSKERNDKLSLDIAKLRTDHENRLENIRDVQDFLNNRIEIIEDNLDCFDGMDERIVQSEARDNELLSKLDELRSQYSASLEESKSERERLKNSIEGINNELIYLEASLEAKINERLERISENLETNNSDINSLRKSLQQLDRNMSAYNSRLSNLESSIPQLEQGLRNEISSYLEGLRAQLAQYQTQLNEATQEYNTKIDGLREQSEATAQTVSGLEASVSGVQTTNTRLEEIDNEIAELKAQYLASLEEAKGERERFSDEINQSLEESITQLREEYLAILDEAKQNNNTKIDGLREQSEATAQTVSNLEASVSGVQATNTRLDEEIAETKTTINSNIRDIEYILGRVLADKHFPEYLSSQEGGKIRIEASNNPREMLISYFRDNLQNTQLGKDMKKAIALFGGAESFVENYLIPEMEMVEGWEERLREEEWYVKVNTKRNE